MNERDRIRKHLVDDFTEPIRDPVWGNIYLSAPLLKVVGLAPFQKLDGIRQLGPAHFVYRGANHTRFGHSLGVFDIARRMIMQFAVNPQMSSLTLHGAKGFLVAALLHDLGHYPFAHSIKDLRVDSHESLTARRLMEDDVSRVVRDVVGVDPCLVAAIIDPDVAYTGPENLGFFRSLLSGVLDPDKLDYLNRDAYFCGVPYGIQDVDFILHELLPFPPHGVAVTRKGVSAVESVLFSKYLMYRNVYWHKTVRVGTAMIRKALLAGLSAGIVGREQLYFIDDAEFFGLFTGSMFPAFHLIERVLGRHLYKVVARIPFQKDNALHARLEDVRARSEFETDLAREIGRRLGRTIAPIEIIIDVPERLSFETGLQVMDMDTGDAVPFEESGSVFSPAVVSGFVGNLRQIAIIADEDGDVADTLKEMAYGGLQDLGRQEDPGESTPDRCAP